MPSIVQTFILIFAKLIISHSQETIKFLTDTSFESRLSLKILMDKWLLHQPLFRGKYITSVTIYALSKLYELKDHRVETLRVITYNPSHSNMNSEVNAPFKILCTLIRYVDNETMKKIVLPSDIMKDLGSKNARMEVDDSDDEPSDKSDKNDKNEPIKVRWDELKDDEEYQEQLLDIEKNFEIKESTDKGLADVETGSTYYMSEMLVKC